MGEKEAKKRESAMFQKNTILLNKIDKLEKQIEKMKNWCNCGNYLNCIIKSEEEDFKAGVCHNCTDWELKEIEK